MDATQRGKDLIRSFETLRLDPYRDGGGVLTIGWGHAVRKSELRELGRAISRPRAEQLFSADVEDAEGDVERLVSRALEPHQFDALVSFVFNLGGGQFAGSTLLRMVNRSLDQEAAEQFLRWRFDNGKLERGLLRRRGAERALWLGDFALSAALLDSKSPQTLALYRQFGVAA